ncbi:hypothetical protein NPIL_361741, partial [Nephila pilipes]
ASKVYVSVWTPQEEGQRVAWFTESKSDTQFQWNFQTKFKRDPHSRLSICEWHTSLMTTSSVLHRTPRPVPFL